MPRLTPVLGACGYTTGKSLTSLKVFRLLGYSIGYMLYTEPNGLFQKIKLDMPLY